MKHVQETSRRPFAQSTGYGKRSGEREGGAWPEATSRGACFALLRRLGRLWAKRAILAFKPNYDPS